jgi:6,7-dimethyl-8-ribityllumazine synthase
MAFLGNSKLSESAKGTAALAGQAYFVIVRTDWNTAVVDLLEAGCRKILTQSQVKDIKTLTVPGAFEIPFRIKQYWEMHKYRNDRPHVFIALGCVIRGDTPHFDYICKAVSEGIMHLNLHLPVPTIFGVLTVDTQQQADERVGGKHGHKGEEAAWTALKMLAPFIPRKQG